MTFSLWPCVGLFLAVVGVLYLAERGTAQSAAGGLPGARPTIDASHFATLQAALDALPKTGGLVIEEGQAVGVTGNVFSGLTTKAVVVTGKPAPEGLFRNNILVDVDSDHEKIENQGLTNVWKRRKTAP